MKMSSDKAYEIRAKRGVGFSLGAVAGAILARIIFNTDLAVIIGTLLVGGLGAVFGTRVKSEFPLFLWIEYPKEIGKKFFVAGLLFVALMYGSIAVIKAESALWIQLLFLLGASISVVLLFSAVAAAAGQWDDLLKQIQLEGFALGFGISIFVTMLVGLFSMAFSIPSNWLIHVVLLLFCALLGRLWVAWKYR